MSVSTCYNNLSFGRWEELCHEFMSVLPIENPRMSFDELSSPTWHFIFLKDDCFLQPSCEIISSSDSNTFPSNLTSINNPSIPLMNNQYENNENNDNNNNNNMYIYDDEYDNDNLSTSSATSQSLYSLISPPTIEPLFDGIDLNQQHNENENNNDNHHHNDNKNNMDNDHNNNNNNDNNNNSINNKNKNNRSIKNKKDETLVHDKQKKSIQSKKPILITLKRKRRKNQQQQQQHSIKKDHKRKKHDIINNNRSTTPTTLFEQLSQVGIDWCRYCGTTEGVNWRPGPWGKRTLCNKHGCDYKGYGLASRLPRLDLSSYRNENIEDRLRPVIQEFCSICQERGKLINMIDIKDDSDDSDVDDDNKDGDNDDLRLIPCDGGCSRAFHLRGCLQMNKENNQSKGLNHQQDDHLWYCSHTCYENKKKKKVVVDLPRKQPLMRPLK